MTDIYIELGGKKAIAWSLEWPGWCRIRTSEETALQALIDAAARYRLIAQRAELDFAPGDLVVVERLPGDANTAWGVPSVLASAETRPIDALAAQRNVALLRASWDTLEEVVAASPAELRKGPRGGGRNRDEIRCHVIEAERAYARKIGVRHKPFEVNDKSALKAMREEIAAVLSKHSTGEPLVSGGWNASYAVRRMAWHVVESHLGDRRSSKLIAWARMEAPALARYTLRGDKASVLAPDFWQDHRATKFTNSLALYAMTHGDVVSTVVQICRQRWTKAVSAALKPSGTPAFPPHSHVL